MTALLIIGGLGVLAVLWTVAMFALSRLSMSERQEAMRHEPRMPR